MIAIVDYGAGNLRSVANAFHKLEAETLVTDSPADLERADAVVLPGVGAFGDGMRALRAAGLEEPLRREVLERGKPYLGICLGMQFLCRSSSEMGVEQGLGWLPGVVERITPSDPACRIPHIGWNDLQVRRTAPLFEGLSVEPVFYFVHSFHVAPDPGAEDWVSAVCDHGGPVTAAVQHENIFGVQFHPEKSQKAGMDLLRNFIRLI